MAGRKHDVFISHAREDKEAVARPLADALRLLGLEVWFDDYSLKLGDSLRECIDRGLRTCRFGVVVLSPKFFSKRWTKRELNALTAREMQNGRKVILPVWHEVDLAEVMRFSPALAERLAVRSADGIPAVADAIATVVRPRAASRAVRTLTEREKLSLELLLAMQKRSDWEQSMGDRLPTVGDDNSSKQPEAG